MDRKEIKKVFGLILIAIVLVVLLYYATIKPPRDINAQRRSQN